MLLWLHWEIARWLNMMNETLELNDVPIKFYLLCDVAHINSTRYFQEVANERMYLEMTDTHYNPTALNIHFTRVMQ